MTTRERFNRSMRFEPVDQLPNFELGWWGHTVERWLAEGMPEEITREPGFHGCAPLGIDRRDYLPLSFGPIPAFEYEVLEETDRHILFRDGEGILHRALKEGTVRGTRPSMDQYIAFAVEGPDDWPAVKARYDPTDPARYPANWDEIVAQHAQRDYPLCAVMNGAMGFYSHCRRWMGTENLSLAFHDQPALVHEMMDHIADFLIGFLDRALTEVQVDYFNWFEDFAYKTGPLFSPATFREFFLPRYQRVNGWLRSKGVPFISLDSDGNIDVLLPLIIEADIDGIWPLEQAATSDPYWIRREFGRDLTLSGGIDKRELAKDRPAIDAELRRFLPLVADGGFIPTIDHAVSPDISWDNFLYYLEVKQKLLRGEGF